MVNIPHDELTRRLADLIVEALEIGSRKQEHGVIAEIFRSVELSFDDLPASFSTTKRGRLSLRARAAELLAEAAPTPEFLLNEFVRCGGRFIAMLDEVYQRLARHAVTEAGTSDNFRLQRAGVKEDYLTVSEAFIERVRHLDYVLRTTDFGRIDEAALGSFVGWDSGCYGSWPLHSTERHPLRLANAILNLRPITSALTSPGSREFDPADASARASYLSDAVDAACASADRLVAAAEKVVRAYVAHADLLSGIDAETAVGLLFPAETAERIPWASTTRSMMAELELFRVDRVLALSVGPEYVSGVDTSSIIGLNAQLEPVVLPASGYRECTGISELAFFVAMYRKGFWPTGTRLSIAEEPADPLTGGWRLSPSTAPSRAARSPQSCGRSAWPPPSS